MPPFQGPPTILCLGTLAFRIHSSPKMSPSSSQVKLHHVFAWPKTLELVLILYYYTTLSDTSSCRFFPFPFFFFFFFFFGGSGAHLRVCTSLLVLSSSATIPWNDPGDRNVLSSHNVLWWRWEGLWNWGGWQRRKSENAPCFPYAVKSFLFVSFAFCFFSLCLTRSFRDHSWEEVAVKAVEIDLVHTLKSCLLFYFSSTAVC
jgi:hypothetical protein